MSKIKSIKARRIVDSRANWTVEVDLTTQKDIFRASVPSGVSKGKWEAIAIETKKAVENVNEIIGPKLKGKDPTKQKEIDDLMLKLDGTENKSYLGANAVLAVSMAVCRAGAAAKNLLLWQYISQISKIKKTILPLPFLLMIEGGAHAGSKLDFQEFMVAPQARTFSKNLQIGVEIYQELKKIIRKEYGDLAVNVGDEGGFTPPCQTPEEALDLILASAKNSGHHKKIKIILDIASSQFFKGKSYQMKIGTLSQKELLNYYLDLIKKYPILGLEDPFAEDDWQAWQKIDLKFKILNSKFLLMGDDLLVTNPKRMKMAKEKEACNAAIIKINQIGTISEAIAAARLAKSYNWKTMVSQRGSEPNDDFISDFAVGIGADFIKAGAAARGERVAKYNRLLRIEEEL